MTICVSLSDAIGTRCHQDSIRDSGGQTEHPVEPEANAQHLGELARRLVSIQDEERQRLAGELHDQVGANLATINLNLRSISKMIPNPDPQLEGILKETGDLLAEALCSIRHACADLRPATLDYSGLVPALQELVQRVGRRGDMVARFRQENMHGRLPAAAESMLFRIAQEALTNCAKHSNARTVEVVIVERDGAVVLTVSDNGSGFDPELAGRSRAGLGLLTMRERAAMAGGVLSVMSRPGEGTRITTTIRTSGHSRHSEGGDKG